MTVRAADYPPPFAASEFVSEPTDPVDERIEVGFLIVGAGPAGLAAAIRLGQLMEDDPTTAERLGQLLGEREILRCAEAATARDDHVGVLDRRAA